MKKSYEQPQMYAELFVSNHYCAACKDPGYELTVAPMEVRCQTFTHLNTARDEIFFDVESSACKGKFDEDSGSYVQGHWSEYKGDDWFYEDTNKDGQVDVSDDLRVAGNDVDPGFDTVWKDLVIAFKGFFTQDNASHVFYAKVDKTLSQYNLS